MPGAERAGSIRVLDASVAVRWVVAEEGSEEAAELLAQPIAWIAPRLMLTEAASALRRKVAAGDLRVELAAQALESLVQAARDGLLRLADDEDVVLSALFLALTMGHKVPDCLYIALAERESAGLISADRRLSALARQRGIPTQLVPSA